MLILYYGEKQASSGLLLVSNPAAAFRLLKEVWFSSFLENTRVTKPRAKDH